MILTVALFKTEHEELTSPLSHSTSCDPATLIFLDTNFSIFASNLMLAKQSYDCSLRFREKSSQTKTFS